ncbi:MAG: hypothetical protein IKN27_04915 [Selenomonadaceae bacterium]|nr:hypothetical protein [Selenomonadaceae bacterium]
MIDEVRAQLSNSRNEFQNNVQDFFGQKITQDIYEPFELELAQVEQAIAAAYDEQQIIKNLLSALRMIL